MYFYERVKKIVFLYNFIVVEYINWIFILRNKLGMCGIKDEGVVVLFEFGFEGRICINVLSSNWDEFFYFRILVEILRIVYGIGDEYVLGGFYFKGVNGKIVREYFKGLWD